MQELAKMEAAAKKSKRKQDDLYDSNPQNDISLFSSPLQMAQRRKVTAASTRGTPRKNIREKRYYQNMLNLNNKFSTWAKEEEQKLCTQIENGTLTADSKSTFYFNNVNLYIEKAKEIRRIFYPATRDVLTFGQGESGQLGHKSTGAALDSSQPKRVKLFSTANINVCEIECGGQHTIAVTDTGKVFTFGSNDEGQLGNVDLPNELGYTPKDVHGFIPSSEEVAVGLQKVPTWKDVKNDLGDYLNTDPKHQLDPKYEEQIVAVTAGETHCLCLSSTGRVYFFGAYKDSDNKKFKDDTPKDDPREYKPLTEKERKERESNLSGEDDDDDYDVLDDEAKKVVGTEEMVRSAPKKAPVGIQEWPIHVNKIDGKVVKIASGGSFNAAIVHKEDESTGVTSKTCWTWGISETGQLSRDVSKPIINPDHVEQDNEPKLARYNLDTIHREYLVPRPVQWAVGNGSDRKVEAVCCGGYHLLVVSKDIATGTTSVHSCGLNKNGQLGLGKKMAVKKIEMGKEYDEYPDVSKLTEIESLRGKDIIQVAAGFHHSLALESNGNLYGFGRGDSGQLGNTDSLPDKTHHSPDPIPIYLNEGQPNPKISQIACGENQNLVLTADGEVYTWGYGDTGALGHKEDSDEYKPRKLIVMQGINKKRAKSGETPIKAIVKHISGGAQHSALVCELLK